MFDPAPTRRRLLQGGGLVCTTALAGCFGGDGPGGDAGDSPSLDSVPSGAQFVLAADVDALLSDDVMRSEIEDLLTETGARGRDIPTSVSDGLDSVEDSLGLDLRDISRVVVFAGYEPDAPMGAVCWTDWTTDEVRSAASDAGATLTSAEHGGRELLVADDGPGGGAIGVLEEGTFAFGERRHVETVVDVHAGDASPVDGRVRDGFEAAADGAMRVAFAVPDDVGQGSSGGNVDVAAFRSLTHGYAAYVIDGEERRTVMTLEAESADGAADVQASLEAARSIGLSQLGSAGGRQQYADEMQTVLESTEITQSGSSVTVTVGRAEVMPVVLVAVLGTFVLGFGSRPQQSVTPQAIFEFDYDADAGQVTVTHHGGDHVSAHELYIYGENLASAPGADMTASGPWAGSTSATVDGQPAVAAGDGVTVGVAGDDYTLRVVWQSADGTTSSELASDRGPAA